MKRHPLENGEEKKRKREKGERERERRCFSLFFSSS
jgi:hypothetical protein